MDHPPWRLTGLYEKAPRKNDVFFLYKGKDWSGVAPILGQVVNVSISFLNMNMGGVC